MQEREIPSEHRQSSANDRAESLVNGGWSLNDVSDFRLLTKDFAISLESIDDRRLLLQERDRECLNAGTTSLPIIYKNQ
ncbi:hypothetical protein ACERIT_16075 [Halopenitus sp. H-Gu1]|uniref:hypothetical protein n=1 Tax=Halopenitus sp. H-Gu1 TaxID=3242697 RepID=UPI00359ED286